MSVKIKAGHKRLVYVYSIEYINIAIKKTIDMKKYILINCDCDKNIGTANDSTILLWEKFTVNHVLEVLHTVHIWLFFLVKHTESEN